MFRWSPIIFIIEIKHLFKIQTEVKQKFFFPLLQLMIIVDDAGAFIPAMNHSPWDGVTVADFVMPFFLFIVGVALALAYKVVHAGKSQMAMLVFRLCSFLKPPTVTSTTR